MNNECLLGRLLYIGFCAEKGRCGTTRWPIGYKHKLRMHLSELMKLVMVFVNAGDSQKVIDDFRKNCKKEKSIWKYYEHLEWDNITVSGTVYNAFPDITEYMRTLLEAALHELNQTGTDTVKVSKLLRCLHNLPRVFPDENGRRISEKDAIAFMLLNADDEIKAMLRNDTDKQENEKPAELK